MRYFAAWARALAVPAGCCSVMACADAAGRFGRFEDRRRELSDEAAAGAGNAGAAHGGGASQACRPPAPGEVQGSALLALETTTAPGVAILFFGQLETPALGGATSVKYSYKALDASDRRTEVGEALVVGPYVIAADGSFEAPTPRSTLPGTANVILPGIDITSQLTLHGTICGASEFYCGTVTGTIAAPIQGPATGQFGLQLLRDIDDMPERPRFGCEEDALAPALPPANP